MRSHRRARRHARRGDASFGSRLGRGAVLIGLCFAINLLTTPSIRWWVLAALGITASLLFEWMDGPPVASETAERVPAAPPTLPTTAAAAVALRAREAARSDFGAEHLAELRRLKSAVEDLHGRLSESQRELLGSVREPVETLDARVEALVKQGRAIDAELRIHDGERIEAELEQARRRVEDATGAASREDERAALAVLEQQHETLQRVREQRGRIDARLRTAVGLLRALHLDLVECLSTDLDDSSGTLRRLGDQVREVSRSVDALAGAVDEIYLDDLPQREPEPPGLRAARSRKRDRG